MTCYVYLIEQNTIPRCTKIGVAADPDSRLARLQTANPCKLYIKYQHRCKDFRCAVTLERELHKRFADRRLAGEWFIGTANQIMIDAADLFHLGSRTPKPETPEPAPVTKQPAPEPTRPEDVYGLTLVALFAAAWLSVGYIMLQAVWNAPASILLGMVQSWGYAGGCVFSVLVLMQFIQDMKSGMFKGVFAHRRARVTRPAPPDEA